MASATFPRDTELRDTPTALPLAAAGVFLVLAAALTYRADLGLWLSHHHAHVIEKALLALDRGRIELIGFVYPPLPFLLLLPRPSPAFAGLLGAGCGALVVWILSRALGRLSLPHSAAAIMLLFPAVAALLSWMSLSWVFTGQPLSFTRDPGSSMFAFLRPDGGDLPTGWSAALSATGRDLIMAPIYMVMAVVVAWYRPLRLPVFLVFALFVLGLRTFGFVLPDYFATT